MEAKISFARSVLQTPQGLIYTDTAAYLPTAFDFIILLATLAMAKGPNHDWIPFSENIIPRGIVAPKGTTAINFLTSRGIRKIQDEGSSRIRIIVDEPKSPPWLSFWYDQVGPARIKFFAKRLSGRNVIQFATLENPEGESFIIPFGVIPTGG